MIKFLSREMLCKYFCRKKTKIESIIFYSVFYVVFFSSAVIAAIPLILDYSARYSNYRGSHITFNFYYQALEMLMALLFSGYFFFRILLVRKLINSKVISSDWDVVIVGLILLYVQVNILKLVNLKVH
jgi:hypothetical protein